MAQIITSRWWGGGVWAYKYKWSVDYYEDLPTSWMKIWDTYNVVNAFTKDGKEYPAWTNVAWTWTEWDALWWSIDLSEYQKKLVEWNGIDINQTTNEISVDTTVIATKQDLTTKQDTISDLATIRQWAAKWATAIQPNDNVSELANDAWYIDKDVNNLTNYTKTEDLPDFTKYQLKSNMVTSLNSADDTHYPTAKAVKDAISSAWGWDVSWPNSSTDWHLAVFDWNTGKIIKDWWAAPTPTTVVDNLNSTSTTSALSANQGRVLNNSISTINWKIPSAASTTNQLADKDYVNDSINSVTAYYITKNAQGAQFATYSELANATTFYSGGVVRVPTRNDYTIVLDDENHDHATTRYIYNDGWEYQYTVNETALTQAQLNALNSWITSAKVSQYDGYASGKQDALVSGTNIKTINNESILWTGDITISAPTYTAGNWIDITNDEISVDSTVALSSDVNTKTFYLSSTSDLTNAQAAYDWYVAGKNPIVVYWTEKPIYIVYDTSDWLRFRSSDDKKSWTKTSTMVNYWRMLSLVVSNWTVASISTWDYTGNAINVLSTGINYSTPYTPQYAWSPATKKYVDDKKSEISVTLTTAGWSSNTQSVTATGVTASNTVIVSPNPSSMSAYTNAKVFCSAQGSNSLTFSCTDTPTGDIVVNVVILN